MKSNRDFSLIEFMGIVVIIAMLATIPLTKIISWWHQAKDDLVMQNEVLPQVRDAFEVFYGKTRVGEYPMSFDDVNHEGLTFEACFDTFPVDPFTKTPKVIRFGGMGADGITIGRNGSVLGDPGTIWVRVAEPYRYEIVGIGHDGEVLPRVYSNDRSETALPTRAMRIIFKELDMYLARGENSLSRGSRLIPTRLHVKCCGLLDQLLNEYEQVIAAKQIPRITVVNSLVSDFGWRMKRLAYFRTGDLDMLGAGQRRLVLMDRYSDLLEKLTPIIAETRTEERKEF